MARASPSSSSRRATWGSGADTRVCRSPCAPSVRRGARARAKRSAQARDTASTVATVPCPTGPPDATRISRSAVATSPLSSATAPHSRNAGDAEQAASYVFVTGDAGDAAAVSARQSTWMPARGPSCASRSTASRTSAPPGSPSTTTSVYGPSKSRSGSVPAVPLLSAGSWSRAQDGRRPAARVSSGMWSASSYGRGRAPGPVVAGAPGVRGVTAVRFRQVVLEAAQQLVRAGGRLFAVVGEEQAAVLAVGRAQMGEPAEPGPFRGALLDRAGAVRAEQDDLQGVRRVQRRELCHHRASQPREARPRSRQAQRLRPPADRP